MGLSEVQYRQVIDSIYSGLGELSVKIQQVGPVAETAANRWYVPPATAEAIIWLGDKMIELASAILAKVQELIAGAYAPAMMFKYAWEWQDIRILATGVAGELQPGALSVDRRWTGDAADAYVGAITPQSEAAARIGAISDKTAMALTVCAASGLAFYVAVGIILVKFIVAMATAIVALGSVVFSWAGAGLIVEEAAVNTGLIIGAITALVALLGAQATQMSVLHGEAGDGGVFSGGRWPTAVTGDFSDATVTDGTANWSIQR